MRIFFVVPDGVGIRNYLYSGIIPNLKGHTIGIIHHIPDEVIERVAVLHQTELEYHYLPLFNQTKKLRFLHELSLFSRLLRNSRLEKNPDIETRFVAKKKAKGFMKLYYKILVLASRISSQSPKVVDRLDNIYTRQTLSIPEAKEYRQVLKDAKPDVIICTHQRSLYGGLMMEAAKTMGIPTVCVIFSWDNLPKSKILFKGDYNFVWSTYMKNEMRKYYPSISESSIIITGTPQFECYQKKDIFWTKEEFLARLGIPAGKKVICFSGGDLSIPNDQYYAEHLAEGLLNIPEETRPVILIRPSPADLSGRFSGIEKKYPSLVKVKQPEWTSGESEFYNTIYPTWEDVQVLSNVCFHCELVINIGSTMGLDFAFFNKPAVYITYELPHNQWHSNKQIYRQQHFRSLDGLDAVVWVNSREELIPKVMEAIDYPERVATDRLKWKKLLTNDIENASENIAVLLKEIAGEKIKEMESAW